MFGREEISELETDRWKIKSREREQKKTQDSEECYSKQINLFTVI